MSSLPSLLTIPRELRDIIYEYCLFEPDGYHYDHQSGKLRSANGSKAVDLSLMYACKTVAAEMHGLAFRINAVTFSTTHSDIERLRARQFSALCHDLWEKQHMVLELSENARFRPFFTSEILAKLNQTYPQFVPESSLSGELDWYSLTSPREHALSEYRAFTDHAWGLLSRSPGFHEACAQYERSSRRSRYPMHIDTTVRAFRDLRMKPWDIPSEEDFERIRKVGEIPRRSSGSDMHVWNRLRFRFSAAASAIKFLKSAPPVVRLQIRRIILNEDHESVAAPACHALGLIQFCQENLELHVERRLSLWKTVLPMGHLCLSSWHMLRSIEDAQEQGTEPEQSHFVQARFVTPALCRWIKEALALFPAGMPQGSFSLVFDGEPTPNRSSEIFDALQKDDAWASAIDRRSNEPSYHSGTSYWVPSLSQIIRDMVAQKSFISCNFPLSDPWDIDALLEENHHLSLREFIPKLKNHEPRVFQTSPPLPSWIDLRLAELIPEELYRTESERMNAENTLSYFGDFSELFEGGSEELSC